MSARRLIGTAAGMAAAAVLLAHLSPSPGASVAALGRAQETVDAAGADVLVLHLAGLLAWLVWCWGALGLALTAASALPGLAGALADGLLHRLLPAGARRAAALALGVGLGLAPPALGLALVVATPAVAAAEESSPTNAVPDWPGAASPAPADDPAIPDWPQAPAAGEHVVVRGDCLWDIAERHLTTTGSPPTAADVATAVTAWWQANADVIGPDPDLLLPGQVLRPPLP
ncbi:LysM peptidoglycan-binding domain-containing protein [Blastococcus sp. LR1]|uniref:LysM peptidoglycan-binding domain-containing protein n=1 Tax=Blastococcus sp. LR1 TaxID=2877000 RepID=UPI001CCE0461|nr:LysM domain-containing protein [Blastococcus sp. LR1]MCA0146271.1 LysM peptidoglycan-binding domain-containing protein [Blastococcus sp. LR1]